VSERRAPGSCHPSKSWIRSRPDSHYGSTRNGGRVKDHAAESHKFRDLARELECDEDEAAFDERLKKLAKPPPPVEPVEKS